MNDPLPELRLLAEAQGLHPDNLFVALRVSDQRKLQVVDRHSVPVTDGVKLVHWQVPALSGLFRGSQTPPPDMDHYPEEYTPQFFFIEKHVLSVCEAIGDRTDQEMEEIFSTFRRRPDGRSLGPLHDFFWQAAALLLGTYTLSGPEFEALFTALEHSTRRWAMRPVSRFYTAYLHQTFDKVAD